MPESAAREGFEPASGRPSCPPPVAGSGADPSGRAPSLRLPWVPVLLLIRAYQRLISPALAGHCRFIPSCSEYAREAIARHGWKGAWLAVRRLSRCHPLGSSGYDPVPR